MGSPWRPVTLFLALFRPFRFFASGGAAGGSVTRLRLCKLQLGDEFRPGKTHAAIMLTL